MLSIFFFFPCQFLLSIFGILHPLFWELVICFDRHILKWKPFGLAEMKQVDECVPAHSQMDFYLY